MNTIGSDPDNKIHSFREGGIPLMCTDTNLLVDKNHRSSALQKVSTEAATIRIHYLEPISLGSLVSASIDFESI